MGFIREVWALTRFEHALMLALAVLIGESIVLNGIPPFNAMIIISLLVPIFSEAGSFALNDYLDVESDRINKKTDRPLVKGTLKPEFALWLSGVCMTLSVMLASFFNAYVLAIALVFNILAILYNWKLKDIALAGNAYIALTMAIPFIFGNFIVSTALSPLALVLAGMGFVSGLAREILKTVQDMEGDMQARKSKTLPMIIGAQNSVVLASVLYALFVPLTAIPFRLGLSLNIASGACVAIADLAVLYMVFSLLTSKDRAKSLKDARRISLAALFIGLLGLLVASV